MATLSGIWIYPIKSLGGISLTTSSVSTKGLLWDRRWMLIDESGQFMTQRKLPVLAKFQVIGTKPPFVVQFNGQAQEIPIPESGELNRAAIWDDSVDTVEVSKELSEWFTQQLNQRCKLVYFPELNPRPVDANYAMNNEHVSLADAYPILAISEASLSELNSRLENPVPMIRFRPNLILKDTAPFEEDSWNVFTINNVKLAAVKPCARCVVPTIDPELLTMSKEPTKTLATYRSANNKIYFGQNVLVLESGNLTLGSSVNTESYRSPVFP